MTPLWIGLLLLLVMTPGESAPPPDVPWWVFAIAMVLAVIITGLRYWSNRPWTEAQDQAYRNQLAQHNALIALKQSKSQAQ